MSNAKKSYDRRKFIRASALAGIGVGMISGLAPLAGMGAQGMKDGKPGMGGGRDGGERKGGRGEDTKLENAGKEQAGEEQAGKEEARTAFTGKRVGIIGLDSSHGVEFTKALNATDAGPEFMGYKIVAAYPKGSTQIESSMKRIPAYTEEVKKWGVEIVDSVQALIEKVDFVLLETNDGNPHLGQALEVMKAGKTLFVDKPVAASLVDVIAIYDAARHYRVPIFSASSLRYMSSAQDVVRGKVGKLSGADAYSPCALEKTHADLYWYGIHGVELLYTVMGVGCRELERVHTEDTEVVTGTWADGRIGTFRGTRLGGHLYGGTVYGEKENAILGPFEGYKGLLVEIIRFFDTGISPVKEEETLEIYTFMEAADESKRRKGDPVKLDRVWAKAKKQAEKELRKRIG